MDDPGSLVTLLKVILILYPPFSYTKIFTNVSQYSGYHFDIGTRKWEHGIKDYDLDVFASEAKGSLAPISTDTYTRYSDLISMVILLCDALLFIILTWYFDHVVESNRGRG